MVAQEMSPDHNAHFTSPIHPRIMNQSNESMSILDNWRPRKVEEHGIRQVLEARKLFDLYGAKLSREDRTMAHTLLTKCVDLPILELSPNTLSLQRG
jgi:hypothetical protein